MADKPISGLTAAESVGDSDLFVLEQDGQAKKLTGQTLMHDLAVELDGHGGIASIAKTGTSGLVDTYTITFADGTNSTFSVTNGDSIDHISTETVTPSDPSRAQDIKVNIYLTSAPSTVAYYFIVPGGNTGEQGIQGIQGIQGEAGARAWLSSSAPINADGVYVFSPSQISTPTGITATPQVGDMIWWTNNYYFITNIAYSGGQVNAYGCNNTYAIFPGNYINNVYYSDYGLDYSGRLQEMWEGGKALFCIMPQQQQDDPQNILALTNVTENYQGGSGDTPHTRFIFSAVHHNSNGNVLEVAISGDSAINSWSTATYSLSGGGGSDDIYWVTYGTTTSAQIEAAYQSGKMCLCLYGSALYVFSYRSSATNHTFCSAQDRNIDIITCNSDTWSASRTSIPLPQSSGTPAALGTAARGTAATYSRSDHVHDMPTAAQVGAIVAPSSPSDGQFLVYSSSQSAWVAQTVPTANGVSF